MTWNSIWPIGTSSVRSNRVTGAQNTEYIETTMGPSVVGTNAVTTRDHFWNVDPNLDGRHRFIQSPAFTVGGLPTDPVVGTSMDGVLYTKTKTATESTVQQDVQPFFRNTSQVFQLLGIRAMGVWNGSAATPAQADVVYSHNLALQAAGTPGIVRTATGRYTITFATALPSTSYLVLGGAVRNNSSTDKDLHFICASSTTLTNVKSTTTLKVLIQSDDSTLFDPLQAWFICFGG